KSDTYLNMIADGLVLMRELLAEAGSILVHADYHVGAYIRALLDEIFGQGKFRNEIVWKSQSPSGRKVFAKQLPFCHESILWFSKSSLFEYVPQYRPYDDEYVREPFRKEDERGR